MPNVSVLVAETKQSVLRPVVLAVVRQLMEITKIADTVPILYPDDIGKTHQPGSAITGEEEKTVFPGNDKVVIDVEEDHDPANILSTAIAKAEQVPIFQDNMLGILIKPIYSSMNVTINFKFKGASKSIVTRWRDDIRLRTSAARDVNLHTCSYHYVIPKSLMIILKELHRLRENVEGYDEDFTKYVLDNSTTRLTNVANLSGEVVEPAIAETQLRIVGVFDFEGVPEKLENEEDGNGWIGSFTYKFKFDKPLACNMTYPLMVHNQTLDTKYRPDVPAYDLDNQLQTYSLSLAALHNFESQEQVGKYVDLTKPISIPAFDEFEAASTVPGTFPVFTVLCQLDLTDKKSLLNLNELGDVAIDSDILEFIKGIEYRYLNIPFKSILHLDLYRFESLTREDTITIDADLNVKAVNDLSLRTNHRIRFSIMGDITYLDNAAIRRMLMYPKAAMKIVQAINKSGKRKPGFEVLAAKGYLTEVDIMNFLRGDAMNRVQFNTVQISNVIALRSN